MANVASVGEFGNGALVLAVCAGGDVDDCEESDGESIVPEAHCHRLFVELFIVSSNQFDYRQTMNTPLDDTNYLQSERKRMRKT